MTIPDSVTCIGNGAFDDCWGLSNISIPETVTSIGDGAFVYSGLSNVTIPANVVSIGDGAFSHCRALMSISVDEDNANYSTLDGVLFNKARTKLIVCPGKKTGAYTIPDSVTIISVGAFGGCQSLTSVTIPNSVTSIEDGAFSECRSLASITIPDSVISIGNYAFYSCTNLSEITIPEGITSIGENTFCNCRSLESITISQNVTSIGDWAFTHCNNLKNVTIPASVINIGESAFSYCSNLITIDVNGNNAYYTSKGGVLFDKNMTELLTYPGGKAGAYTIPDSVISIGNDAFSDCSNLTALTIPSCVTYIGDRAFSSCNSLAILWISDNVVSIGDSAFANCASLTDVYYAGTSDQWERILVGFNNTCLTEAVFHYSFNHILDLPNSLTSIESEAFAGLNDIDAISVPATVTSIADDAFDTGVVIIAPAGSHAEAWAVSQGYKVINP